MTSPRYHDDAPESGVRLRAPRDQRARARRGIMEPP